jgi:putative phage-type endonuclease
MNAEKRILEFLKRHSSFQQRTKDWYAVRGTTIGGSEIAIISGHNKYQSYSDLMRRKLNMEPRITALPLVWGTFFEDITIQYLEAKYKTKVYGENAHIRDENNFLSYSPDGYMIKDGEIYLIEIKSPIRRIPSDDIPEHYKPQIWLGLEMSKEIATKALFVDCVYRICERIDLSMDSTHYTDIKKGKRTYYRKYKVIACGYSIGETNEKLNEPSPCSFLLNAENGYYKMITHYGPFFTDEDMIRPPQTGDIMCWKIFNVKIIEEGPNNDYINTEMRKKINTLMTTINKMKQLEFQEKLDIMTEIDDTDFDVYYDDINSILFRHILVKFPPHILKWPKNRRYSV